MGKVIKRKFYRPGTLEVPGTRISLKTQPYTNGVLFDTSDPITSFRAKIIELKGILESYEAMKEIPGLSTCFANANINIFNSESIAKAKLLLDFLIESPIEIMIKEQTVTEDMIADALNQNIGDTAEVHND